MAISTERRSFPVALPIFYPALDGLRAVAFLMVFSFHYGPMVSTAPILQWGWVGVDLFFVLSGFLITGILYDSLQQPNYFKGFYIRRALRIFPLFYGFWSLLFLLTPVLHVAWNRYNVATSAYIGNFFWVGGQLGLHADPSSIRLARMDHPGYYYIETSHLWSLCVEEQFYLLWPAFVWLIRSRRGLLRFCFAIIVIIPMARMVYFMAYPHMVVMRSLYVSSWSRVDTLLVGAALALWLRGPLAISRHMLRRCAIAATCLPPAVFLLYGVLRHFAPKPYNDPFVSTIGFTLIAIAGGGVLLLSIDPETALYRGLTARPLTSLGRISYGMYFFHFLPAVFFFVKSPELVRHHAGFLTPLIAFLYTVITATLSFRFIESPFLRLKARLAPRPGAVEDPQPISAGAETIAR